MEFPKVDIIAAPTQGPRAVANSSSCLNVIFALALIVILRCQRVLYAAYLSPLLRASWFAWLLSCVCRIFAAHAYSASKLFRHDASILGRAIWKAKFIRRLRKKVIFELLALMLSSCGNSLCLLLFWPGWWFLGLICVIIRWSTG
ncbi:hypothetical protein K445DRAFT_268320 [Daldinia sp. EC12]|nr:hypothetical protein K445DRAFT_268320 [Daldinia sp. EC12]